MKWLLASLILLTTLVLSNCGFYKLNPAGDIDPLIKTVSVAYFDNNATLIAPELSPSLTEKLRDKFISQTNLDLVETGGDMHLSGEIISYTVEPVASQDNSIATQNRLTISVRAKLVSEKVKKHNFEQSFTQFQDFDATKSLSEVESGLIDEITDRLVQEIFNKSTLDW